MAATDKSRGGVGEPASFGFAITPSDGSELEAATRGIWVGGAGAVKVVLTGGDTVTLSGVTAGTLLPIRAKQVLSTGTTATLLVGLY